MIYVKVTNKDEPPSPEEGVQTKTNAATDTRQASYARELRLVAGWWKNGKAKRIPLTALISTSVFLACSSSVAFRGWHSNLAMEIWLSMYRIDSLGTARALHTKTFGQSSWENS